jgi:hypothetical protein
MTLKTRTPLERGTSMCIIGGLLAIFILFAVASMIAWIALGLPITTYDPLKIPHFFWYYRGDPYVVRAMAGGLLCSGSIFAIIILNKFSRLRRTPMTARTFRNFAGNGFLLRPLILQSRLQPPGTFGEQVSDEISTNCVVEVAFTSGGLGAVNKLAERSGFVERHIIAKSLTINVRLASRSKSTVEQRRVKSLSHLQDET